MFQFVGALPMQGHSTAKQVIVWLMQHFRERLVNRSESLMPIFCPLAMTCLWEAQKSTACAEMYHEEKLESLLLFGSVMNEDSLVC